MEGIIIKNISNDYLVKSGEDTYLCKARGKFRKMGLCPFVGDRVIFDENNHYLLEILDRKNSLVRPSVSNVDQAIIVSSVKRPELDTYLLDKLLTIISYYNIEPIICFTKLDLLSDSEKDNITKYMDYYRKIGYLVIYNTEIDEIKSLLKDKTSVFTGQTGAGKSTLLNKLNPDWNLEVGEVSLALGRGKHTTRVVELFELYGGKVMDTPGFSSLELSNYSKEEIRDAFIEFSNYPCLYKDCMHTKEAECVVKKEVFENNILESRYLNYLNFIGEDVNES